MRTFNLPLSPLFLSFSFLHLLSTPFPPVRASTLPNRATDAEPLALQRMESYPIDRNSLHVHFMTEVTGLEPSYPNGWPEWAKFNSHMQFNTSMPEGRWACAADWTPGVLPGEKVVMPCQLEEGNGTATEVGSGDVSGDGADVKFMLSRWWGLGERRPEMSMMLGIWRNVTLGDGSREIWYGERPLYMSASGPMFCTLGAPLDGMRCFDFDANLPLMVNFTKVGD